MLLYQNIQYFKYCIVSSFFKVIIIQLTEDDHPLPQPAIVVVICCLSLDLQVRKYSHAL